MHHLLFFFFSFSLFARPALHEQKKWLNLLHYRKTLTGFESEADGKNFFLHPEGKTDPKKELERTIELFSTSENLSDEHPICRFPLRYKWLNQKLGGHWKTNLSQCSSYLAFFSKLASRRASLVFSSYYLTNPNSAFGHTLLRLSRFEDKSETEILDYGINYAAKANEKNPFLYAWKGLFGGFRGEFAAVPYYYKIREYSDFEFRDLWSFDLKLTQNEVLELVDHIWELGSTDFDYFYFHENCSYHLLSLLEAVRPELELTSRFRWYTIPADTVRILQREGLIEEGRRRESVYSRLLRVSEVLSGAEKEKAWDLVSNPRAARAEDKAEILDTAIEAYDYLNFERVLKEEKGALESKSFLLRARALNPQVSSFEGPTTNAKDSPALSHSPTRLTLAQNYFSTMGKSTRFEFRASLHDLLDPSPGSLKEAQLEMGKVSFELQERNYQNPRLVLDQFTALSLKNFPSQNIWASPLSWEVEAGMRQLRRRCWNCPAGYLMGSLGNALSQGAFLFALLVNSELNLQSQFEENYRWGAGPKALARIRLTDAWALGAQTWYHFNTYRSRSFFQDYEWWSELEARCRFTEQFTLSLKGGSIERPKVSLPFAELGLQYFYE